VFYSTIGGIRKEYTVTTVNNPANKIGRIECAYPHSTVTFYSPSGCWAGEGFANLIFLTLSRQQGKIPDILNMEVLYVGQAFGTDGKRITLDRLYNHEKAIEIYGATQKLFPDYEIWFMSMNVEAAVMASTLFEPGTFSDDDIKEIGEGDINLVYPENIPVDQQITAAEAAFIRYFNTSEYNKQYLDFPKESKRYQACYDLDLNSIGIQLSTWDSIGINIFSKSVPAKGIHAKTYFLHEGTERKDMFWMLNEMDS
jgi:hypothetical protein